MIIFFSCPSA